MEKLLHGPIGATHRHRILCAQRIDRNICDHDCKLMTLSTETHIDMGFSIFLFTIQFR